MLGTLIQQLVALSQSAFFIAVGIIGIGFLIGFHELGHFIFCKLFGIKTPSFSIGMGPKLFSRKIGETEFVLAAIPLGGYVEIAGAAEVGQGDQKEASSTESDSFASKPYYQKMLVMAGGVLFNLIFAYVALSVLYYVGMPKSALLYPSNASRTISTVEENSPAAQAGLKTEDIILAIDGASFTTTQDLIEQIKKMPGASASLSVERQGQPITVPVKFGEKSFQDKQYGFLGIDFAIPRYPLMASIQMGIQSTHTIIKQTWHALKSIFTQRNVQQIGGPLMVISQTVKGAEKGIKVFILLLAFISVNLALLNIIPLPIMDGGQALMYTIEALLGHSLPDKTRLIIHYITWIMLLALVIFLSIKDAFHLFGFL